MNHLSFRPRPIYQFLFLLLAGCCLQSPIDAQSAIDRYEKESIYLKGGSYVKDGQKRSMGFMGKKLLLELEDSEAARQEGNRYKKNRHLGLGLSLTGLGVVIAGAITEEDALLWSGLAVASVSIPISFKAVNQMHKAIWLHNRDILK